LLAAILALLPCPSDPLELALAAEIVLKLGDEAEDAEQQLAGRRVPCWPRAAADAERRARLGDPLQIA
jgi:hypothetical protein